MTRRIMHAIATMTVAAGLAGTSCADRSETPVPAPAERPDAAPISDPLPTETVVIDGQTFELELAATPALRARGLMFRDHIDPNGGMLFVEPFVMVQEFWMGHCLTDIDILFLDPRGRVTAMHQMTAEPLPMPGETDAEYRERMPGYSSRLPAQFVIELAGGRLDDLDGWVGQTIDIDVERLKSLAR